MAARSSGRVCRSDPLLALPTGVRRQSMRTACSMTGVFHPLEMVTDPCLLGHHVLRGGFLEQRFRNLSQKEIGGFFLTQRVAEQCSDIVLANLTSQCAHCAVTR